MCSWNWRSRPRNPGLPQNTVCLPATVLMELLIQVVDIPASIPASFAGKPCFVTTSGDQLHWMSIMLKYIQWGWSWFYLVITGKFCCCKLKNYDPFLPRSYQLIPNSLSQLMKANTKFPLHFALRHDAQLKFHPFLNSKLNGSELSASAWAALTKRESTLWP